LVVLFIRGGVLEPEGTVEIKFRYKDLSKTMHRLDDVCKKLKEQMASPELSSSERVVLEKQMKARESIIMPLYHQVAVMFTDLHDTAGRMQEKGCINVRIS
jgi:acetyl-CoA carboxylase carboxyltransferase component